MRTDCGLEALVLLALLIHTTQHFLCPALGYHLAKARHRLSGMLLLSRFTQCLGILLLFTLPIFKWLRIRYTKQAGKNTVQATKDITTPQKRPESQPLSSQRDEVDPSRDNIDPTAAMQPYQPYDAFLVLDVEATCQPGTDFDYANEIIVSLCHSVLRASRRSNSVLCRAAGMARLPTTLEAQG